MSHSSSQPLPFFSTLWTYGSLIKFSHTIFALPFALSMLVIVSRSYPIRIDQIIYILLACVTARTAAMGWNRFLDRDIDGENPRTSMRELPSGKIGSTEVLLLTILSAVCFLFSAYALGMHCFVLAPVVLLVLLGYSVTKRFTSLSHMVLGLALALAPGGVWYALTAEISYRPMILMAAVLFWVAGFDMLYSCQDENFDRKRGLFSIPARVGADRTFALARLAHLVAFLCLIATGVVFSLGTIYYIGVTVFGIFLLSQHCIVSPKDLSRIDAAFFTRNALASIFYLIAVALDSYL